MTGYKRKKQIIKRIAKERMLYLFDLAAKIIKENKKLANRYAILARIYAQKAKLRVPAKWRRRICHNCKSFLTPGLNCRYRLQSRQGKGSHISMTCLECRVTTRYYLKRRD